MQRPDHDLICCSIALLLSLGGCTSPELAGKSDETTGETGETTGETETGDELLDCDVEAPALLRQCVSAYSEAIASCYLTTDGPCAANDVASMAALDELEAEIIFACDDGELFGLDREALVGRLRNACQSEASSLAWRGYGGPQGSVWPGVNADDQACLSTAHERGASLIDESLALIDACVQQGDCSNLEQDRAALASAATATIEDACANLSALIAIDASTYAERAAGQTDCLAAVVHEDTSALDLACGPGHAQFTAPRGEWTQIVVDGDEWGTLCGDGSPYAFQIRLAPEGERLDRVLIALQGGGVCLFEDDCSARFGSSPGLFNALDDIPLPSGVASDDPDESPFANWTKVYLPYCTQDVFAGGGVVETLGSFEMPRYGAVNTRAGIRMVRDVLWKMLDEQGGAGFRPDELIALFGGFSAGGYGTIYNYHWLLDDLQWPRTIAYPDAGLALDNGTPLGVGGLGLLKLPAWGTVEHLPPYCFESDCAIGPVIYEAISPRLKQVPEQQMLILSNPKDDTQRNDAFFEDDPSWMNTMRQSYCDTKDLPGINYYFTSVTSESVHVISIRPELWTGSVAGEVMRDWFERAVEQPDTLESRVEESDFVELFPGVEPYPCQVAP